MQSHPRHTVHMRGSHRDRIACRASSACYCSTAHHGEQLALRVYCPLQHGSQQPSFDLYPVARQVSGPHKAGWCSIMPAMHTWPCLKLDMALAPAVVPCIHATGGG